ncbi:MAG: hypothetical protein KDC61_01505, partial [Saprospiraceae bacterium]|nr:hypothetical protein [Saprospiraceae bacterium]
MKQFQKLVLVGLLISIVACNKEHTPTMEPAQQQPFSKISENLYYSETPIDAVDISNASSIQTGAQSRGEGYYFTTGEGGEIVTPDLGPEGPNTYPNYTGACKFIFRLFDSQNCGSCAFPYATVRFRDGIGGAILASYNVSLGQGWIELNVPQSCAVSIEINCGGLTGEPEDRGGSSCLYKIQSAEYGWNQGGYFGWVPTGLEVYYLFRRFQPKGAFGSAYSQYLCDSWCTWNGRLAVG